MQKENYPENIELTEHKWDIDIDFDFDLEFSVFEYFLMALYAIFLLPFELMWTMALKPFVQYIKDHIWKVHGATASMMKEYHTPIGPCCSWPRSTHS